VGNVPYNMREGALIDLFKSVGRVVAFRLVFDRETGKPKGYGFCEFDDHQAAASAVRNLNNTNVNGRPLRIDLADSDPFLEGKTTIRGELVDGGAPTPHKQRSQWRDESRGPKGSEFLAAVPPGKPLTPGVRASDAITQLIANAMSESELIEVLAQMKAFAITHPHQAHQLLLHHPQVAYAIFMGLITSDIIPADVLNRMLDASGQGVPPGMPPGMRPMPPPGPPQPPPGPPQPAPMLLQKLQQPPPSQPGMPPLQALGTENPDAQVHYARLPLVEHGTDAVLGRFESHTCVDKRVACRHH
ncbi:hypothetical protein C8R46DRAFT_903141, partial [Mycena filopes]